MFPPFIKGEIITLDPTIIVGSSSNLPLFFKEGPGEVFATIAHTPGFSELPPPFGYLNHDVA
jgi:hypothetical protein